MDKLTKEEVLHVADLGKLELSEDDIERFSYQLKELFNEIDKVNEIDVKVSEGIFSPLDIESDMFDDNEMNDILSFHLLQTISYIEDKAYNRS